MNFKFGLGDFYLHHQPLTSNEFAISFGEGDRPFSSGFLSIYEAVKEDGGSRVGPMLGLGKKVGGKWA